ncbi:MAG TPA: glycogen synthase GlgA [Usitatibacter sp.]|nr:glycogen synthase GlgA [Usitatibacter sp.]
MPPAAPLKVLFATPECAPLVKTGGLGDVSAALPPALRTLGVDVRVLLPGYRAVLAEIGETKELGRASILGHDVRLLESTLPSGVPLVVLDCPALYDRDGGPYQAPDDTDWEDNALRFGVLSRAAALFGTARSPMEWRPDVLHCNDWPTALTPVYLAFEAGVRAATLFTIHNLAFQGIFDRGQVHPLALPAVALGLEGLEFYRRCSFLKGGLVYADAINAVSPTYAREITGEALGFGLDGVLRKRRDRLFGVLNGIDAATWNPATDTRIPRNYDAQSLDAKGENTLALRKRMGLLPRQDVPLLGMVSRLTHQKGIDILAEAADALMALPAQVAVVGTGDRELVEMLRAAEARHPGNFSVVIGFHEDLAHLLEAGADMFLMPSRFEPCGMNQMYSQRFGTPPIANATGGLVDTVFDETRVVMTPAALAEPHPAPTGFLMSDATSDALLEAAGRAVAAWRDRDRWRALQRNGMARDFGWTKAAGEYIEIYRRIVTPGTDPLSPKK